MNKWIEGKVISQKKWSSELFSLFVAAPIPSFTAGQFIQVGVEINGNKLFRPYSLVNAPSDAILEFYYSLVPDGVLSKHLATLSSGDTVWLGASAHGQFVLAQVPSAQTLWLFATGAGLGVFLSILKTRAPWKRFGSIILVHSVRTKEALTHLPLISSWQEQHTKNFFWVPVITREKIKKTHNDRIVTLIQQGILEESLNLSLSSTTSQVMLCGNPAMIKEVCDLLLGRNFQMNRPRSPGQITIESYWK